MGLCAPLARVKTHGEPPRLFAPPRRVARHVPQFHAPPGDNRVEVPIQKREGFGAGLNRPGFVREPVGFEQVANRPPVSP